MAHMRDKICAVVQQPEPAGSADAFAQLPPTPIDMPTRSSTARLEQRREELNKLQTTSQAFKEARSVIPRGTGRDKLWYKSGQYWGKAYTIGLILKYEGLPIQPDDACFQLIRLYDQKRAWDGMQDASEGPPAEERPLKRAAVE
ncbi:TPA: hypothetical protein ACH3X1_005882 [Trebouxia sp. C0004]